MAALPGSPIYQIVIAERLNTRWLARFTELHITFDADVGTVLSGPVADQAALRGVLSRLWDLNLTVLALRQIEAGKVDTGQAPPKGIER